MNFRERFQYTTADAIGKGGFSTVYKAYDRILARHVALKFFHSEIGEKYDLITEVKKTMRLSHKNLTYYFDARLIEMDDAFTGRKNIQVGIMEYVEGGDFRQLVGRSTPVDTLNELLTGTLEGLEYLHSEGIIHRDIKPGNILISKNSNPWTAKLIDFGLSKIIKSSVTDASSSLVGTIDYMAPEQLKPEAFGINSRLGTNMDLWSFGIVVYELLFGQTPFGNNGKDSKDTIFRNILQQPVPAQIALAPFPFNEVLQKCLVREADKRVKTAAELISILRRTKMEENRAGSQVALKDSSGINSGKIPINGEVIIGRDVNCQMTYPDAKISRRHARIGIDSSGRCFVEDLGSSNGTYLNGAKLQPNQRHPINLGDTITLAVSEFRLEVISNG